jgi:hypothetical protein
MPSTVSLTRQMRLLDALTDFPVTATSSRVADEEIIDRVSQILTDEGAPLPRNHILAAATALDAQDQHAAAFNPSEIPQALPLGLAEPQPQVSLSAWRYRLVQLLLGAIRRLAPQMLPQNLPELTCVSAQERRHLAILRAEAPAATPHTNASEKATLSWIVAFWKVRRRRELDFDFDCGAIPLSKKHKAALVPMPRAADPLVSAHFRDDALSDRDRPALVDLLYDELMHPYQENQVDWPLFNHLVAYGVSADVRFKKAYLCHPNDFSEAMTARELTVYMQAVNTLPHLPLPCPVPTKKENSLMWWALLAQYNRGHHNFWAQWSLHAQNMETRLKKTLTWVLEHEQAPTFHAKILREAIARKHPLSPWLGEQLRLAGWPLG